MPAIEITALSMVYRSLALKNVRSFFSASIKSVALKGVSLSVREGERVAIVGANGAGKTTFLKILAGLILPSEGNVRICGVDVLAEPERARRFMGFVGSQERSFYWRLSGAENIKFFAKLHGLETPKIQERLSYLLERFDIEPSFASKPFRELATGIQQRFSILRALIHHPRVLIMDEPTRSLDAPSAARLLKLISDISREENLTVLYATHSTRDISLSHRILVLRQGNFVWEGSPHALSVYDKPTRYRLIVSQPEKPLDITRDMINLETLSDNRLAVEVLDAAALNDVMRILTESGSKILHCEPITSSAESALVNLTQGETEKVQ